jgi:hypothetical protein
MLPSLTSLFCVLTVAAVGDRLVNPVLMSG